MWCIKLLLFSKPLMDLLVTLCAQYHLNPSKYTLELVTANRKNTKLKPNALIGMLDVEKILLKPKGEDKNKKTGPQMPEVRQLHNKRFALFLKCVDDPDIFCWGGWFSVPQATVRMVINYKKTQKTILRVSPQVPLADHLPSICEKCEFDVESTVLLRDVHSLSPLDLSCSLNDYAMREVYARDIKSKWSTLPCQNCAFGCCSFIACSAEQSASPVSPVSPTHAGIQVWTLISEDLFPPAHVMLQICHFSSCVQCSQAKIKIKKKKKTKAFSANLERAGKNQSR